MASSSAENMEEESEITRCGREGIERRAILDNLDNALREFELFDLNNNVSRDSEDEEIQEVSVEECSVETLLLPGIKFFNGRSNCDYDQNSIKVELSELNFCFELDLESLSELKDRFLYEDFTENPAHSKHPFRPLLKLLFTSQSRDYLSEISEILILLLNKSSQVSSFLDVIIATLPIGLRNIGGNISRLFKEENLLDDSVYDVDKPAIVKNFKPVENIRYVIDVLQYSVRNSKLQSKGKLNIPDGIVNDLIFTLLIVSQDPQILSSNTIASIQNCLAEVLDIYPSDCKYLQKVQDIVERAVLYWQDSLEAFNPITAYKLCFDVIPLSIRGKQLKSSLAYSSLSYCIPSHELSILDRVSLYQLARFCRENISEFFRLDCKALYSVILLIDAAIMKPVSVDNDEVHVNALIKIVNEINSEKSSPLLKDDYYHKSRFVSLVSEITAQWNKLVSTGSSEAENLY